MIMKRFKLLLLPLILVLAGCSGAKSINVDDYEKTAQKTGELSAFALDNPLNGAIISNVSEFKWNASENAETYILEVCSSDMFISNVETIDYYKKENITDTSFKFNTTLAFRDTNYYWRVTAKNTGGTKVCNEVFRFYVSAADVNEVQFDLGETDDWKLHEKGSYADVTVSNSKFFSEQEAEPTVQIAFKMEDTKRGNEESDGWLITSRTIEKSIYGTDALFFNCFYAGDDSNIFIRLIDRDNEFWHCPIQISRNAKQSVILKFSDFEQRTRDVTVANMTFDFERIKTLEIVFERTFGDGVFLMSNMRAIKFSNYKHLFIEHLNFNDYKESQIVKDTYAFEYQVNDDYELEMSYYGTNDMGKPKINSYGFLKYNVNQYFGEGNAVKISVKYVGSKGDNANVILRVYEEDTDRWSFTIPFSYLTEGEYTTLVIPFDAFAKSYVSEGRRQFYFILALHFGLEKQYGTGKLFFKDFEIVNTQSDEYKREEKRIVGSDGLIENFDNYDFNTDMYFIWQHSENNKDEYLALNKTNKTGYGNVACGQFEYKSDMEAALYYIPISAEGSYSSFSLWLKDASMRSGSEKANNVEDWAPTTIVKIRLATGEIYDYKIPHLDRAWYQYDIPFTSFELSNEDDLTSPAKPITAEAITHVGISFQYFYYDSTGNSMPLYSISNPVYIDNIYLTNFESIRKNAKERIVNYDTESKTAVVEDFESYEFSSDMLAFWNNGKTFEYQQMELSNDVSSLGGTHSLKGKYITRKDSPSYFIAPALDKSIKTRVFRFDVKCDYVSTVYLNFYVKAGSGSENQFRATLNNIGNEWTRITVGFSNITDSSGEFSMNYIQYISRISFGVTSYAVTTEEEAYLYIDNMVFDGNYTESTDYSRLDVTPIV